jgi:hypothetical protein
MPARKDLGSILVDENIIGQKDLDRVERDRKDSGRSLWQALIDAQLTTEDEIFFVMAQRFGTPVLAEEVVADVRMPAVDNLRRALTREQALSAGLLPIDYAPDGTRVTVVMVDPSDEQTLAAFLRRAQIPEGRALLGRRSAVERAIDRCFGGKSATAATIKAPPVQAILKREPTATVKLDPELQAEIQRLPEEARKVEPMGPDPGSKPQVARAPREDRREDRRAPRPRRPTPQGVSPSELAEGQESARAEERFSRALIQAIEALARELEERLLATPPGEPRTGIGRAGEMARIARRVARQLGLGRRTSEEIGVAALLFAIDHMIKAEQGAAAELFSELGWPAAGEGGLVPILRALTAASAGFARSGAASSPPLGARIISVVADYLELGAASGEVDIDTVSQLLRASSAGAPVVDALLRVLESERGDVTPSSGLPAPQAATSLLKEKPSESIPVTVTPPDDDAGEKTVRKAAPTAPSGRARREPPEE